MNGQVSYSLAQAHTKELYRKAEQVRAARDVAGRGRFAALWHRIAGVSPIHRQLQAPSPTRVPVAGGATQI